MKFRTTTKWVKENYSTIISAPYATMQTLLRNHNAIAYTAGIYGWNYDIYDIDGIAICTGYRGMPTKCVKSEHIRKYETAARRYIDNFDYTDYTIDVVKVNQAIEKMLDEFIKNETAIWGVIWLQ